MAKRKDGPNKSEAIRKYKAEHGSAGPKEIAAALAKDGIKCTPQFVSTVLSNAKRSGRKGKRKAARSGSHKAGGLFEKLVLAKKLSDQMGGVEKARAALDALAQILG